MHPQDALHAASLADPAAFWAREAAALTWHTAPSATLTTSPSSGAWQWFPDGELSCCYNALDRHVRAGNGAVTAIIYDSPVTRTVRKYTYAALLDAVQLFAGVLKDTLGIRRGDVALIYMPMIPEAVVAMLACNRIGAVHNVVFGGFSAPECAKRIDASAPRVILTASCGIEGAKGVIPYQPPLLNRLGEYDWQTLVELQKRTGRVTECVPLRSDEPHYMIYTSGTTGAPKGIVRETGGHAVGLSFFVNKMFGIRGPGDVIFTASDIGWVVGHSYIVYGPLLAGATTVLFEGKPVGTPDAGTFWRVAAQHKVNVMFTAPTALRAIRRLDPELDLMEKYDLQELRALFLAGERSEPQIVELVQDHLRRKAGKGCAVIDHWWSTESGCPISGLFRNATHPDGTVADVLPIKPGSAGKPLPGWDVRIVDDDGNAVARGAMGNIVMKTPLGPTGFRRLWGDEGARRFQASYMRRFSGQFLDTGDAGMIDQDGYIHVMSRTDDILNVAGHRLSTSTIEQAVISHAGVAECAVVGIPDDLKGHMPFAFVTLASSSPENALGATHDDTLFAEINALVRRDIGGIASLGGMICAAGVIPKTRSGKTLRRVLRELVENGSKGIDRAVAVPATVEDATVVDSARKAVARYFEERGRSGRKAVVLRAKL
ncbi:hypothetical protein DRE_04675 [Drechslerella stenobrocha 248]|uniref:Propionyl-CoA synthetase n=1 Tax=Drechslerella stenobrocha 248 TaxID=1043628 RepID=W7HPP9_9PEZI|nr:hypothetical protein DRE_04675 [Drechslerella stenobrocha 248]